MVSKILEALDFRRKIKVLVHEAFMTGDSDPYYFIKITNLSNKNIFTVTHIWVKDGLKEIDIINPNRVLPHKLEVSEQWETWIPKNYISNHKDIFKNFRVVLSDEKVYKSKENKKVRPSGHIAG